MNGCYLCTDVNVSGKRGVVADPPNGIDFEVTAKCVERGRGKRKKLVFDVDNAKCLDKSEDTSTSSTTSTTTTMTTTSSSTTTSTEVSEIFRKDMYVDLQFYKQIE